MSRKKADTAEQNNLEQKPETDAPQTESGTENESRNGARSLEQTEGAEEGAKDAATDAEEAPKTDEEKRREFEASQKAIYDRKMEAERAQYIPAETEKEKSEDPATLAA